MKANNKIKLTNQQYICYTHDSWMTACFRKKLWSIQFLTIDVIIYSFFLFLGGGWTWGLRTLVNIPLDKYFYKILSKKVKSSL